MPVITEAFSELGYHRATTAKLAARCGIQENVLYRLWTDKQEMFLASIDFLRRSRLKRWRSLASTDEAVRSTAERMLENETQQVGELRLHRLIFAALAETDDPRIRRSVQQMYRQYQSALTKAISAHRRTNDKSFPAAGLSAWAAIGLVTVINIITELNLVSRRDRKQLFSDVAGYLLDGKPRLDR
ncbi:MAG: helix-turn-helix domain-containing protein [Planctomycetota bacterium]